MLNVTTGFHPSASPQKRDLSIRYVPDPSFLCILFVRLFQPVLVGGIVDIDMVLGFHTHGWFPRAIFSL